MYLFFALILATVGTISSPGSVSDVPFARLTLGVLIGSIFSWACYLGAIGCALKSLGEDRIWPWRWTLPYVGNLLVRTGFAALFMFGAYAFAEKKHLDGWALNAVLVLLGILLLFTFFSSEFEYFKEKKNPDEPSA